MDEMRGWRIEVRRDLVRVDPERGTWSPDATDPNGPALRVRRYAIEPQRLRLDEAASEWVAACVWVLRDTIYVSRALDDAEADTLRRLLDAELRGEREAPTVGFTWSYGAITVNAPEARPTDAEAKAIGEALGQLSDTYRWPVGIALADSVPHPTLPGHHVAEVRIGMGTYAHPRARLDFDGTDPMEKAPLLTAEELRAGRIAYNLIDGWRRWACPTCQVMHEECTSDVTRFVCRSCSYDSTRPDQAAAPRAPKVGDEIEVRASIACGWHRARVVKIQHGQMQVETEAAAGWWDVVREREYWRWPEAKAPYTGVVNIQNARQVGEPRYLTAESEPKPTPAIGDEIEWFGGDVVGWIGETVLGVSLGKYLLDEAPGARPNKTYVVTRYQGHMLALPLEDEGKTWRRRKPGAELPPLGSLVHIRHGNCDWHLGSVAKVDPARGIAGSFQVKLHDGAFTGWICATKRDAEWRPAE